MTELDRLAQVTRTQRDTLQLLRRVGAPEPLVRRTAEAYITAHYEWQTARYGKVRVRLSTAKLLR